MMSQFSPADEKLFFAKFESGVSVIKDRVITWLALLTVAVGIVGYFYLVDSSAFVRWVSVLGGVVGAAAIMYLSSNGKQFIGFSRDSFREAQRVTWPTRKETLQMTGVVFAFAVVMAIFLGMVDGTLAWLVKTIMGRG